MVDVVVVEAVARVECSVVSIINEVSIVNLDSVVRSGRGCG